MFATTLTPAADLVNFLLQANTDGGRPNPNL